MKIVIVSIALLVSLMACATVDEVSQVEHWNDYAHLHNCKQGVGKVWKCTDPTPSWWLVDLPEA